uniref:Uncharacterized protein n=1 Tax=Nothobranchius furzeri TaxID=105023 RepID=A0A8C6M302_NOTFU
TCSVDTRHVCLYPGVSSHRRGRDTRADASADASLINFLTSRCFIKCEIPGETLPVCTEEQRGRRRSQCLRTKLCPDCETVRVNGDRRADRTNQRTTSQNSSSCCWSVSFIFRVSEEKFMSC